MILTYIEREHVTPLCLYMNECTSCYYLSFRIMDECVCVYSIIYQVLSEELFV